MIILENLFNTFVRKAKNNSFLSENNTFFKIKTNNLDSNYGNASAFKSFQSKLSTTLID